MTTIQSQAGLYAPTSSPIGGVTPKADSRPASSRPANQAAEVTVHLSSGAVDSIQTTYTSSLTKSQKQKPTSELPENIRELSPVNTHPKALEASRTFLDIAHFDNGMHIIDVFA